MSCSNTNQEFWAVDGTAAVICDNQNCHSEYQMHQDNQPLHIQIPAQMQPSKSLSKHLYLKGKILNFIVDGFKLISTQILDATKQNLCGQKKMLKE
jgi:hypothetical protein